MRSTRGISRNSILGVGCILAAIAAVAIMFRFLPSNSPPPPPQAVAGEVPAEREAPARRTVRQGNILDVSKEASMAGLETSRITIDMDDVPLNIAATSFGTAAGLALETPFSNGTPNLPRVTMHLKDAPVMEGLLQLRQQGNLSIREARANGFALTGSNTSPGSAPVSGLGVWCISGPFAFVIPRLVSVVEFGGDGSPNPPAVGTMASPELHLFMEMVAEPQVKVLQYPTSVAVEAARDEKDQTITTAPSRQGGMVALQLPAAPGKKIAILRGSAQFKVAGETESFQTEALSSSHKEKVGGVTVEIEPLQRVDGTVPRFTLKVRYSRGDLAPDKWSQLTNLFFSQRPRVLGVNEEAFTVGVTGVDSRENDTVQMTFNVMGARGLEAHHLVIELPTEQRDVRVPFEFKNLLLPS